MRELMDITKALADENRVRILACLKRGELCVCQIIGLLDLAPSTVSKHLFILKQSRLVDSRKDGRWMHYRLADGDHASPIICGALEWLSASLRNDPQIANDAKRLSAILKMDPEVLCCQQRQTITNGKSDDCASSSSARATPAAVRWPRAGRATSRRT